MVNHYGISVSHISTEEFEDTKGVIRIRISKKDRQHNRQKNGQSTTYKDTDKSKDRVTRTPIKTGVTRETR